ncbi:uncharacterized protein LOC112510760 isoform X3 [Cynara cardunculus var. scolymus]|uniref:uncharacterized protein LOC112510760 isoform X3 n=1 Tax=Cynara cardunculus var. scolymus TaxID=59895 RepID=UPI000D623897|nr:uncharacterized protein LOC112510760 isoform X3 [Cynara cardunculus var. scolymus]
MPLPDSLTPISFLLLLSLICIHASVHNYAGLKFSRKGNAYVVHGGSEGIYYSHPNLNQSSASSNGDAYIRFEKIIFRRPQEASNFSTGLIYAILFEVDDRETIGGSAYGGQRAICCTSDLAKLGACKEGEVIHRLSAINPGWPEVFGVSFDVNEEISTMQPRSVQITRTGMYNLYFMHCEPRLGDMVVEGKTIWKNPSGYLPEFNESGVRPTGITIWAVTFGTVKRTVSRLIILTVSMGYGVVRPTLGGLTSKVVMLGGTFFLASEVLELVEHVGAVSDLSGKAMLFLSLPVAVLDAFFVLWIFTSLSATLNKLQAKRMMAKLDIYRKFTNALAVAVIVSVGWICYELYFKSTDIYNEQWQNAWIIPAFWQVLSFSLLCVICALWAPSQNSMRYAYSDDGSEEFDKEDSLTLIKPSAAVSTKDENELGSVQIEREDGEEDKRE